MGKKLVEVKYYKGSSDKYECVSRWRRKEKTQLLRPTPNSEKFQKIGESSCSSKLKSLKKIAVMNYLFSLVSELALPFDSGRSGSFSSDFLVGFRGFDSFQFRHLVVASRSVLYFQRKDRNPASRIYSKRICSQTATRLVIKDENTVRSTQSEVLAASEICCLHFLPLFLESASLIGSMFQIYFRFVHFAECPRLRGEGWYTSRTITRSGKKMVSCLCVLKGKLFLNLSFLSFQRKDLSFAFLVCWHVVVRWFMLQHIFILHTTTCKNLQISRCHYLNNFSTVVELRCMNFSHTVNLLWHDLKIFTPLNLFRFAAKEN